MAHSSNGSTPLMASKPAQIFSGRMFFSLAAKPGSRLANNGLAAHRRRRQPLGGRGVAQRKVACRLVNLLLARVRPCLPWSYLYVVALWSATDMPQSRGQVSDVSRTR
jgi:hypothetical protein